MMQSFGNIFNLVIYKWPTPQRLCSKIHCWVPMETSLSQLMREPGGDAMQACFWGRQLWFKDSPSALPNVPRTVLKSQTLPPNFPSFSGSFWKQRDPLSGLQGEAHGSSKWNEENQWVHIRMAARHVQVGVLQDSRMKRWVTEAISRSSTYWGRHRLSGFLAKGWAQTVT